MSRTHRRFAVITSVLALGACNTQPPAPEPQVGELSEGLVTNCSYLNPGPTIDFDKELVIRDISVVEDPCRTDNNPPGFLMCPPTTVGVWTFKKLMTEMAGTTPPAQFVAEWLHTSEIAQTVNGFTYPSRMPDFTNSRARAAAWRLKASASMVL